MSEAENVHIKTLNVVGDSQNSLKCSIRPLPMATDSLLQLKMLYCDLKLSVQLGNLGTLSFLLKEFDLSTSVGTGNQSVSRSPWQHVCPFFDQDRLDWV